jgi:thiamine biosynthesis protein ThiS
MVPGSLSNPMQITINGESTEVPTDLDMNGLIEHLGLGDRRIAVEVNRELVPRSRFDGRRLCEGDRVEIIHAVGGG